MNASVTFRPLIFLYNIRQLPHEQAHISDVKQFASEYADSLGKNVFTSNTACEDESFRLAAGFGGKMHELALRSNLERHPNLRTRRSTMPSVEGR